jgi:N-acetylglucosaminyl-diphospho-decaprenol L-rhamnosyltransferase
MSSAPKKIRMAIVIVHYKTPRLLEECIATVLPEIDPALDRIFVVDSASGESDVAQIRSLAAFPAVTLFESSKNLGFAGANNLAIRHAQAVSPPDYFLLLNPDTLIRPGAFATLLAFLRNHPDAACVGPRLEYPDATPQLSAFGDHTPVSELLRGANIGVLTRLLNRWQVYGQIKNTPHRADWLAGACVLLRASVLDETGLLDDNFFMYYEEADFFRRARKRGLHAWYEPAAHVVHLVGQSSGVTTLSAAKRLPAYWFDSRHRYFRKHYGYLGTLVADTAWLTGHLLMRARRLLTGVSHSAVAHAETRDLLRHSAHHLLHLRMEEAA